MRIWAWVAAAAFVGVAGTAGAQVFEGSAGLHAAPPPGGAVQRDRRVVQTSRETRTLALGPNGELNLETVSGDITVTASGGRDVVVEITRESRGRTDEDARLGLERVQAQVDVRGTRATIHAEYPHENQAPYSVNVAYRVTAPAGTHVDAHVVSGDISVTGIHGDLSANTVSGNVKIADAARVGEITTVSGDITVDRSKIDGPLEAHVVSGTIRATDLTAARVNFNSVSGDLILQRVTAAAVDLGSTSGNLTCTGDLAPRARYQLQAHSGDIRLAFSGGTGFEFEGRSFSGSIRSNPPIQVSGSNASRGPRQSVVRGTVGDGSAYINATTFSGNITIEKQ
jgi:DUF4097 and DUF4098 domain-containing protein YvlB